MNGQQPSTVYDVALEMSECVVPGGVRRVTWLVYTDSDWTLASALPGARVEQKERGPGMVWLRQVVVPLALGARLMRVESAPMRTAARDPLEYLLAPSQPNARRTRRSYFAVSAGGELARLPAPEKPAT